jgi:hypothetical protein
MQLQHPDALRRESLVDILSRLGHWWCCNVARVLDRKPLDWIDLRKAGHKAPTYRQNDSIPKELRTDSYGIATRWLRAVLNLLLHYGCNLRRGIRGRQNP